MTSCCMVWTGRVAALVKTQPNTSLHVIIQDFPHLTRSESHGKYGPGLVLPQRCHCSCKTCLLGSKLDLSSSCLYYSFLDGLLE